MARRLGKARSWGARAWRKRVVQRVACELVDIIPFPVCVVSLPAQRLEVANRAFCDLLQIHPIGRTLRDVFPSGAADALCRSTAPRRLSAVLLAAQRGRPEIYLDWLVSPLLGGESFVLLGADVSEYVRVISELREKSDATQREKREQDQFLAALLHELRNPLNSIRLALEVARHADSRAREDAWLVLERQTKHVSRLIDDLFDVTRGQVRTQSLRRERVDVAVLIQQAVECTAPLLRARNHSLVVDAPAELWVEADPSRLTQVVCNLLGNAAKYTGQGGSIRIIACHTGREIAISISDTGIGIPRELQSRIFDVFVRAPEAERRSEPGLGLGLHIVRTLIRLHGGSVDVQSDGPGRGSKFTIHLPSEPATLPSEAAWPAAPP